MTALPVPEGEAPRYSLPIPDDATLALLRELVAFGLGEARANLIRSEYERECLGNVVPLPTTATQSDHATAVQSAAANVRYYERRVRRLLDVQGTFPGLDW